MNANPFTKLTILSTVCALAFVCYPPVNPNHPEPQERNVHPIARSFANPEIAPEELIARQQEIVNPQSSPAELKVTAPAHPVPAHPRIHPKA